MTWTVELPFSKPLSLNDRMHHMVKAKAVAAWRSQTKDAVLSAGIPPCTKIRTSLMYIPAQNRRRDPDNLVASMKPVVDALVDANVVPDDTQEYVERVWPLIMPAEKVRDGGRFVLVVEKLA